MPFTCSGTHAGSCFDPWMAFALFKFLDSLSNIIALSDNKGIDIILGEAIRVGSFFQTNGTVDHLQFVASCCILEHPGSSCMATVLLMNFACPIQQQYRHMSHSLLVLLERAFMIANFIVD
jgi:hypothetical protein